MMEVEDQTFMRRALELAEIASNNNEVPVGAVVVLDGKIVGEGSNRPISSCDPTAHAEIQALRSAASAIGNYRLPEATLYVTIEPCTMCAGAIVHARIKRLVFAAREPKAGAIVSQNQILSHTSMNTTVEVQEGILAEEASGLISAFFAHRREKKKALKQQPKSL